MARITDVYRAEDLNYVTISRRQLPVSVNCGDNLMILMDLNHKGLMIDCPPIRGKELEEFTRKFNLLDHEELCQSLEIDSTTFLSVLNQSVQCVGCRRRVERLFYQLTLSGHPTLDPLVLKKSCTLSIVEERMKTPQSLGTLLYRHHDILNHLTENKLRNKTRCILHSLDAFRSKPFSETWREVWSSMKNNCRDELAVIEAKELHEVLENYLKKHKFCNGCRTKIEKAYNILVGETTAKEKGFVAALYANIKKCHPDKHIHVITSKIDFLDALIRRAEPEVNGSYSKLRERHAKTLEIAQEEVLTCVGMIMYERLRRIYVSLREEERACQVLAAVGIHALCRSFDTAVEKKQGISNLELLYQEISRAEKAKEHKREMRKLKKKKKKIEKKGIHHNCEHIELAEAEAEDDEKYDDPNESVDVGDDDDDDDDDADADAYDNMDNDEEVSPSESSDDEITVTHQKPKPDISSTSRAKSHSSHIENVNEEFVLVYSQSLHSQKSKKRKQKRKTTNSISPSSLSFEKAEHNQHQHQQQHYKKKQQQLLNKKREQGQAEICALRVATEETMPNACVDCCEPRMNCPCENDVRDSGYGSDPNSRMSSASSSPEGSEVSCSDGFCNHDQSHASGMIGDVYDDNQHCDNEACVLPLCHQLSLLQMLDDFQGETDDNEENYYIPKEVVLKYEYQREQVQRKRLQLRETLKENFARMCMQRSWSATSCNHNKSENSSIFDV